MNPKPADAVTDSLQYRFEQEGQPTVGVAKAKGVSQNGRNVLANVFDWSRPVTYVVSNGAESGANTSYTLECVDVAPLLSAAQAKAMDGVDEMEAIIISSNMSDTWMPRCIAHSKVGTDDHEPNCIVFLLSANLEV